MDVEAKIVDVQKYFVSKKSKCKWEVRNAREEVIKRL